MSLINFFSIFCVLDENLELRPINFDGISYHIKL